MLCLTLTESTIAKDLEVLERNRRFVSMSELRVDCLASGEMEKAVDFPKKAAMPIILTCRRISDGGKCELADKARIEILSRVAEGSFAYVDIEDDVKRRDLKIKRGEQSIDFEASLKARGIRIIRSFHDFEGVPADLFGRISKLAARGDIPKVAVMPQSMLDVITLFRIHDELREIKEKIVIGMGAYGVCTRILYKRCGSMLSFCSDNEAAPGQLSAQTMKELYHADSVNDLTHIYGVIGNPVLQTKSPVIHNPGFHAIHYNAIYVPFQVDSVRAFFKLAEMLPVYGFSVTIPHKRNVLPYLGRITREVKQIGSCNTVVHIQSMWKGINTDYYGFLEPLSSRLTDGTIKSALVIGAGGASRAIVWALRNHDVKVTVVNRTVEHAKALAMETMSAYDSLDHISAYSGSVDLVVQTTSVGMTPHEQDDASKGYLFSGKEIAFDLVYKPRETVFLRRAKEAGCRTISGALMLLEQGKLQFEAFTGYHYPSSLHPVI
ncbi:MAG: shikimate dehydrogenase [Sphaerochaetaceae bacterium]|jgi:3-dehydroquinate dehydratase/shikimate dehydrogenase